MGSGPLGQIVYISNFPQFRSRGGVIENQFFPKFKKVQIFLGEGGGMGQENYGLFPQIMVFFYFEPSPNPILSLAQLAI